MTQKEQKNQPKNRAPSKLQKLKEEAAYLANAVPKVADAYTKYAVGDRATDEVKQFRQHQCESCVLYTYNTEANKGNCNRNKLASSKDELLDMKFAEQAGYPFRKNNGVKVAAVVNNEIYLRGCGCRLTGTGGKWELSFNKTELDKDDGTGPCPRGRWSQDKLDKWKHSRSI